MTFTVDDFKVKATQENAQIIADLLPQGKFWQAKNILDSQLRKFMEGLAGETSRSQSEMFSLANDYIPNLENSFIGDWERLVGIPDSCFTKDGVTNDGDITHFAARRRDILVKLSKMNLQTQQDYMDLAEAFGVTISINNSVAPYNQFRWEIIITGVASTGWDYDWDFPWQNPFVVLLQCVFNKQRPAHTFLEYSFV